MQVAAKIDGKRVEYTRILHGPGDSGVFEGWIKPDTYVPNITPIQLNAFVMGAGETEEPTTPRSQPSPPLDIEQQQQYDKGIITIYASLATRQENGAGVIQVQDETEEPDTTALPEDKKWFLRAGLKTEVGETVINHSIVFDNNIYEPLTDRPLCYLADITYDNIEYLQLRRQIDIINNKDHRTAVLASPSQGVKTAAKNIISTASSASSQPKQTAKRTREDKQLIKVNNQNNDHEEEVQVIGFKPAPVKVDGRVLDRDERAQCDLTDEDSERVTRAKWSAVKINKDNEVVVL